MLWREKKRTKRILSLRFVEVFAKEVIGVGQENEFLR